jgi:Zn finger protein HypA/HybF involved in hydrogenase expression
MAELETREVYTECFECDEPIEKGLFNVDDNSMYLECPNCREKMTAWDWYDDWEKP